jgi:hypothetical protein
MRFLITTSMIPMMIVLIGLVTCEIRIYYG